MASSWGSSWGGAWGNSWGVFVSGKKPRILVIQSEEAYEEILEAAPKKIRRKAVNIVRPFTDVKGTPKPVQIDWTAFSRDEKAVKALFNIWKKEVYQEDDDDEEEIMIVISLLARF